MVRNTIQNKENFATISQKKSSNNDLLTVDCLLDQDYCNRSVADQNSQDFQELRD